MSDARRSLHVAESYYIAGNEEAAIETAKGVLAEDPEDVAALALLAEIHTAREDFKNSVPVARDLIALAPELDRGHRALAVGLLGTGKKKQALEAARTAVQCDANEAGNHLIHAIVLEEMTKFEDAERAYREALVLAPHSELIKTNYADFLLSRGRADEARRLVEEASEIDPGDSGVILMRAKMALRDGRIDEARENVMWVLQEDATDHEALHLLAQIKMRTNPVMGIWWRYAVWIERFTTWQRWGIVILLYIVWRFFYSAAASVFGPLAVVFLVLWLGFCVLTWIGPTILNRMVKKELKAVQIKPF